MAGQRAHPSARRWAGLLVLLALIWCTTGLGRPAMTSRHAMPAMPAMQEMSAAQGGEVPARAHDHAVAAPICPMGTMECPPAFQDRPPTSGFPLLAGLDPVSCTSSPSAASDAVRAPPIPAARGGPDLDQLCVSRT